MSTPESIVVSLEWAKKLREAGWPQDECLFWWCPYLTENSNGSPFVGYLISNTAEPQDSHDWTKKAEIFADPTAEEILRRLPRVYVEHLRVTPSPGASGWTVEYRRPGKMRAWVSREADTLANAAAAMYCYLSEQKLLAPQSF